MRAMTRRTGKAERPGGLGGGRREGWVGGGGEGGLYRDEEGRDSEGGLWEEPRTLHEKVGLSLRGRGASPPIRGVTGRGHGGLPIAGAGRILPPHPYKLL